ncbi:MAG: cytochrome b/b6 domain-containing protein, partial [Motiliproteus sp.]
SGHPKHYTGHNPAGGIMILLLIIFLLLTAVTGMATLATEGLGPLANTFLASMSDDWFEDIHEALANLMLLLIGVHIAGVVVSSVLHRENLIRAMFDGRKAARQEESQ